MNDGRYIDARSPIFYYRKCQVNTLHTKENRENSSESQVAKNQQLCDMQYLLHCQFKNWNDVTYGCMQKCKKGAPPGRLELPTSR
jgi:hypothetical protein